MIVHAKHRLMRVARVIAALLMLTVIKPTRSGRIARTRGSVRRASIPLVTRSARACRGSRNDPVYLPPESISGTRLQKDRFAFTTVCDDPAKVFVPLTN